MEIIADHEAVLARRAIHDREAFAELYRCHVTRVYRYLLVHTGSVFDAQDLTSQTFITALEHIHTFRGKGSFAAWLIGLARHKMIDHYRREKITLPLDAADNLLQTTPLLDETVGRQLQINQVITTLGLLHKDRAEALVLHVFGGLTVTEVGQVMNRSPAASKMLIHRALSDLKAHMLNEER